MKKNNVVTTVPTVKLSIRERIYVVGCGGGGGNAVKRLVEEGKYLDGLSGILAVNTDQGSLDKLPEQKITKVLIGEKKTGGMGVGNDPALARRIIMDEIDTVMSYIVEADLVFIVAGMGGGTGMGIAPEIAKAIKETGALTVGIITKPFRFESAPRGKEATEGTNDMLAEVDFLVIIENDKLLNSKNGEMPKGVSMKLAFKMVDEILALSVESIVSIITTTGIINRDFNDIRATMMDSGVGAICMGSCVPSKEDIAKDIEGVNTPCPAEIALERALHKPLLGYPLKNVGQLLINFIAGDDVSVGDIEKAMLKLDNITKPDCIPKWGMVFGEDSEPDEVSVVVIVADLGINKKFSSSQKSSGEPGWIARVGNSISDFTEGFSNNPSLSFLKTIADTGKPSFSSPGARTSFFKKKDADTAADSEMADATVKRPFLAAVANLLTGGNGVAKK